MGKNMQTITLTDYQIEQIVRENGAEFKPFRTVRLQNAQKIALIKLVREVTRDVKAGKLAVPGDVCLLVDAKNYVEKYLSKQT